MSEKASAREDAGAPTIEVAAPVQRIGDRLIVRLPDDASAQLPSRRQVAVQAVMNDYAFATVLEPDGRKGHWLPIDERLRETLPLDEGSTVRLDLEPTKQWPEPEVPEDLDTALAEAPDIAETWRSITPMARWEWVRWIGATRNPATRTRRVEVSISKMRSGKRRPCCFDLSACTDPELSKNGKLIEVA